jgi:hypothetical protein
MLLDQQRVVRILQSSSEHRLCAFVPGPYANSTAPIKFAGARVPRLRIKPWNAEMVSSIIECAVRRRL